jgi:O-antigen ligase
MKSYAILITGVFVAYVYSQPVEGRYISTFKALTGQIDTRYDSSGSARMARANIAIDSIGEKPLGTGWGSQGWVHSDVLQIAASIGIIPGVIFIIAPLFLLFRMYSTYLIASINDQTAFFVCCGLLIFVIISLSLNGNILKVQSGAPLFVLWAMADGYLSSYKQVGSS